MPGLSVWVASQDPEFPEAWEGRIMEDDGHHSYQGQPVCVTAWPVWLGTSAQDIPIAFLVGADNFRNGIQGQTWLI